MHSKGRAAHNEDRLNIIPLQHNNQTDDLEVLVNSEGVAVRQMTVALMGMLRFAPSPEAKFYIFDSQKECGLTVCD
jgi:hypothetical protein